MKLARMLCALQLALPLSACSGPKAPTPAEQGASVTAAHFDAIARGTVDVQGGLLKLLTPRDGVVVSVRVRPGDQVRQGEVLGELDNRAAALGVDMAQAEVSHAQVELAALSRRLPSTQRTAQRWQEAARIGAAEQQQADTADQAAKQLESDIELARSEVALAREKLRQARLELDMQRIVAPVNAEVSSVLIQPGSTISIQGSQPSFVLVPDRPLIIRAEVNESYVSRVKAGQTAEVTLEASPEQPPVAARVVRVSRVLTAGHLSEAPQMARDFECILALDGSPATLAQKLRLGQTVLVKFND